MTISRYKDLVLLLMLVVIIILLFAQSKSQNEILELKSDVTNADARYEMYSQEYREDVAAYEFELAQLRNQKQAEVIKWKQTPVKKRIKEVAKIDSNATVTDSTVCFTVAGVDSIHSISIALKYCTQEVAVKDSFINAQSIKISKDSVYISSLKNDTKKASAKGYRKGFLHGGVVGVLLGLIF